MARGHQKIQSQQKNAEKQAKLKKATGHDQKKAAAAALTYKCSVCMVSQHYSVGVNQQSLAHKQAFIFELKYPTLITAKTFLVEKLPVANLLIETWNMQTTLFPNPVTQLYILRI